MEESKNIKEPAQDNQDVQYCLYESQKGNIGNP